MAIANVVTINNVALVNLEQPRKGELFIHFPHYLLTFIITFIIAYKYTFCFFFGEWRNMTLVVFFFLVKLVASSALCFHFSFWLVLSIGQCFENRTRY